MAPSNACTGALRRVTRGAAVPRLGIENAMSVACQGLIPPVLAVLVQEGQRLEGRHPVEEEHAVEVIVFVLDDARLKAGELQLLSCALAIQPPDPDAGVARDPAADVGDAQAPFPVRFFLTADRDDLRIH